MKILLIEDNAQQARAFSDTLKKTDILVSSVTTVSTLAEALEKIEKEPFEVALLDLTLSDAGGLEAFMRFKKKAASKMAIIVLISRDEESLGLEIVKRGAEDFLLKDSWDATLLGRALQFAAEKHRLKKTLEDVSNTDMLTGLLNQGGLEQVLSRQSAWFRRGMDTVAVEVRLQNFNELNESLGYAVGDAIMKESGQRLRSALRSTDFVARVEGDAFVVLLPQARIAEGLLVAEKLRAVFLSTPLLISGASLRLKAKTAIAPLMESTQTVASLRRALDSHLEKCVEQVEQLSGAVATTTTGLPRRKNQDTLLVDILDLLKKRESYHVVKQPIISLPDRAPIGYEFFSRFELKDFESPDDFFYLCHENNLLTLVDHYCFMNCLGESEKCLERPQLRFHFNLFPTTLMDIEPQMLIEDLPTAYRRGSTCIEISNQQIIGDPSYLVPSVKVLRDHGVLIAMDDVGYGRESLESLVLVRPDVAKIDKKCIIGISQDPARRASLKRLVRLLQSLGVEICAEGIETENDLKVIQDYGIKTAQGYLWGMPH